MFNKDSRYFKLETKYFKDKDGKVHPYKQRRFIPPVADISTLPTLQVNDTQRLDVIAAKVAGKSEHFWKIADVNTDLNVFKLLDRPDHRINLPKKRG